MLCTKVIYSHDILLYAHAYFSFMSINSHDIYSSVFLFLVLQSSLGIQIGKVMAHSFTSGWRDIVLWTWQYVVAKSQQLQMTNWKHGKKLSFFPNLQTTPATPRFLHCDETALFFKSLTVQNYCLTSDKPAGSAKCNDRLMLLLITNMDGSDHRKLSVVGKSKTWQKLYSRSVFYVMRVEKTKIYVTNSYFILTEFNTSQKELLLVSSWSISSLISGGDSDESWVLVHALSLWWLGRSARL